MKLIFATDGGNQFEMDVGNSDSLQDIKEKVEKTKGIPISKQTLSFNGNVLRDDQDILNAIILDGSRIHLQIAADNPPEMDDFDIQFPLSPPKMSDSDFAAFLDQFPLSPPKMNDSDFAAFLDQIPLSPPKMDDSAFLDMFPIAADAANHPPPQEIFITLKMPAPFNTFNLDVDVNETILQLKEKIQEVAKTPIGQIVIKNENGMELPDHMKLLQCQISEKSDVTVEFLLAPRKSTSSSSQPLPPPTPTPQAAAASTGNKMSVVLKYGKGMMSVEVRAAHKVSQLRTKLDNMNLEIPEAYFFIHKQDLMDEQLSFTLHNVAQGDVIEILEGRLSTNMSLHVKTGKPKDIIVETCSDDTIQQLKEKIQIKEGTPVARISIKNENGMELPDHKTLQHCGISSNSGITVEFLPAAGTTSSSSSSSHPAPGPAPLPPPRKNEMGVVLQYKEGRMTVYVKAAQNVRELRTKLNEMNLQLPEAYFFIHKKAVMDEEISFRMQNVAQGDVIQIFAGSVERGGGS